MDITELPLRQRLAGGLRRTRIERGLSQEKVGEILQVHRTYYQLIEAGKQNVSLDAVTDYAQRLGIANPFMLLLTEAELTALRAQPEGG